MGGARLVARVPHTHLVPKGHGLVRVLRCDVRHNVLQERGLLRFGEETERHRPIFHSTGCTETASSMLDLSIDCLLTYSCISTDRLS